MPLGGGLSSRFTDYGTFATLVMMSLVVLGLGETLKVCRIVVERIAVGVVNLMTVRNWSVSGFPNLLVKRSNARTPMARVRREVHSVLPLI